MNVDTTNFPLIFEDFKKSLEGCDFYAVDQEMTGVNFEDQHRSRLMSLPELYEASREVVQRYVAFQFGIVLFTLLEEGLYEVKPYNFYLLKKNGDFVVNTEATRFLASHGMDFQKWLVSGLHYCNKAEEEQAMEKNYHECSNMGKKISFYIVDKIEKWWLDPSKKEEESISFKMVMTEEIKALVMLTLKQRDIHVQMEYDTASKIYQAPSDITVRRIVCHKVDSKEIKPVSHCPSSSLPLLGFRQLWKCITKCKKPLIGHNFWLDIMFMMQMHEAPLTTTYEEYKTQVHELFPCIYDTKTLSKSMSFSTPKRSLHLQGLYKECCRLNERCKTSIRFQSPPGFHFYDERYTKSRGKAHEAGYDAYMTGIVFAIINDVYKNIYGMETSKWENVVSVYGSNYYMSLIGKDFLELRSTFLLEFEEDMDMRLVQSLICTEEDREQIKNNNEPISFHLDVVSSKREDQAKTFIIRFKDGTVDEKMLQTQIDTSRECLTHSLYTMMNEEDIIFPRVKRISRFSE
ncbi:Poly(A)-specific ribonuclease PARN [Trypanosoma conorhini]|uniref:Poly(A)-specific ribonuclease PARN n=1 Tax=Trypanosoma conorhini TaxID=83891 RepID=A0A3R7JS68_9TRYP|nr:Poly(A)-specific ribonuclease PARN [Trypanosoma conorhini]RNE96024.1 Poly(A)-specific ribonuclease PARN [Trypanosoma conorhini]